MTLLRVLIFLCLVINSFERSTPQDDHYIGAVVEYMVDRNATANLINYVALIKEAADQNADIVVFPELTLTNASTHFSVPIYGKLRHYPIPALYPDLYDEFMVGISAAARQNEIYVLVNGREFMDCANMDNDREICPDDKTYIFNTNVVFDRTGAIIDRYRKINLFGEHTHTPAFHPDLGVFTTDFGVTFGHFICFDLMFQVPAVQVVQKNNIKNIAYATMWFSEMPYLTAVQTQEAYAYALDVNFLGAGANNVKVGSEGSGIYSGKAGALISVMPGQPTTRVLVAKVPKVPGKVTETCPGPIYDEPTVRDDLHLLRDVTLPSQVSKPLQQGFQEFSLTNNRVTCTFRVNLNQSYVEDMVKYRAFVHDGTNTYARRELGIAACAIVACKTDDVKSCPYRYNQNEENEIQELQIEMQTYSSNYNKSLNCDNVAYFPVSLRYNKFPLSPFNFTYTVQKKDQCESKDQKVRNQNTISVLQKEILSQTNKERITLNMEKPQKELIAFGIWGRIFTRDIDHNKGVTEEDLKNFNTILDRIYSLGSSPS